MKQAVAVALCYHQVIRSGNLRVTKAKVMQLESETNALDIFGDCRNGTLTIRISHLLEYPSENCCVSENDRTLDVCFTNKDLRAVNLEIFQLVTGKTAELEGYGIKHWGDNEAQIFSTFPMISKMKWTSAGIFTDALYNAEEVNQLLQESLKIKSAEDSLADRAARKLIYSCNEALKVGLCLCMWCD